MPQQTVPIPEGAILGSHPDAIPIPEGATIGQPSQSLGDANLPPDVAARHARSREGTQAQVGTDEAPIGETGLRGVATGAAKQEMRTIAGVGNLANKVLPDSLQIPTPQVEDTVGMAEGIGGGLEQLGEFAAGEGILKSIATMAKLGAHAPQVLALMEKFPKTAKLLTSMASAATVGGVQGGVKGAATGQGVEGAVGGAEGGAIGGALGEVVGMAAKPIAEKMGFATTATDDAIKAAQPGKWDKQFIKDWGTAAPKLKGLIEEDGKFSSMGDAAGRIREAANELWEKEITPAITRHESDLIDTKPIADEIRKKAADPYLKKFAENKSSSLEEFAKKFDTNNTMTVGEIEKTLEGFNAELRESGFYKKVGRDKAAALRVNPDEIGWDVASNKIRDLLYDHLEAAGETEIRDLKKVYGATANVAHQIAGRVNVEARQRPISLKQIIGMTAGISHGGILGAAAAAIPLLDKLYNDPINLLNRAIAKSIPESAERQAVREIGSSIGQTAQRATKVVGENVGAEREKSEPISDNTDNWLPLEHNGQQYLVHPEDHAAALQRLQQRS